MNINEYQLKKFDKVSFELNDELKEAQGFDSLFHLSKTSHYHYFHVKLLPFSYNIHEFLPLFWFELSNIMT